MNRIEQKSRLNVEKQSFIAQQLCFDGVNEELLPLVRMTAPAAWRKRPLLFDIPVNTHLFTSIILLFGFIPIDLHRITIARIHSGGFCERSTSLLMRYWNHDRTIKEFNQNSTI